MTLATVDALSNLDDMRCSTCGKLLAKADYVKSVVEIKCPRCSTINSIFQNMQDQVIITDPDGVILYVNDALEKVTQYTSEEAIGQKPSLWGNQMPREFYESLWDNIKNKKIPVCVKIKNKRKDGSIYDATLRITPVFDSSGEIKLFVAMETIIE